MLPPACAQAVPPSVPPCPLEMGVLAKLLCSPVFLQSSAILPASLSVCALWQAFSPPRSWVAFREWTTRFCPVSLTTPLRSFWNHHLPDRRPWPDAHEAAIRPLPKQHTHQRELNATSSAPSTECLHLESVVWSRVPGSHWGVSETQSTVARAFWIEPDRSGSFPPASEGTMERVVEARSCPLPST